MEGAPVAGSRREEMAETGVLAERVEEAEAVKMSFKISTSEDVAYPKSSGPWSFTFCTNDTKRNWLEI